MTDNHVASIRRFAPYSSNELKNSNSLSVGWKKESGINWENINNCQCVVILGEGKCGKTFEFQRQHQLLKSKKKFSFFIPLELLQDHELFDVITVEEEEEFEFWKEGSMTDTATFFLDAVDELKLRQGTLRKALRKIKQAIGNALSRSRFYISCRPNDWNEELDYRALSTLVVQENYHRHEGEFVDGEKVFNTIISHEKSDKFERENKLLNEPIQVLALLPFNRHETVEFAKSYAPDHAGIFEHYLEEKELWHLYRLPYEIISALAQLSTEEKLGNLEEQLQFGIKQKVRAVSAKKRNLLSEEKALEGVERLALALFMMKRRSIHSEISTYTVDMINISEILTDWTYEERCELLGTPLFDPTGVNAFRFHHRSTQEYLAAKRLKKIREQGLSTRDLFRQLFVNVKEEKIVIPSMEPLVAWMALWYPDIYSEVKIRAPSLMFRQGLPALLSIEYREELICKYVEKFASNSKWCGVGISHTELKRIATPELATVVRNLWPQAYTGYDTRELLLELIYLTPMNDCIDLAWNALFDDNLPSQHRLYAAWSVLEFGDLEQKQKIGKAIVHGGWPEQLVRNILPNLMPHAVTEVEFFNLVKTLDEVPNNVHGLGYQLFQAVKSESLTNEQRIYLRDNFAETIWIHRNKDCEVYDAHSKYDHFVDAVIYSCLKTLPSGPEDIRQWAWCLTIAFHFGEHRRSIVARTEIEELQDLLSKDILLREAYYWACLRLVEELAEEIKSLNNTYLLDYDDVLHPFTDNDIPWLMNAFISNDSTNKKNIAFQKLLQFIGSEKNPQLAQKMMELTFGKEEYCIQLERILNPLPTLPSELEIKYQKLALENKEKEEERIKGWKIWREKVLSSDTFFLHEEELENTLYNVFKILRQVKHLDEWGPWDSKLIETVFSLEFLEALRSKMSIFWKNAEVALYSERSKASKNTFSYESLMSLTAVKCCSEKSNWAESLSHDEAVKAVRISTIELNGFADFLSKLEIVHPSAIEEVFTSEIHAQIEDFLELEKLPIFQDILYSKFQLVKEVALSTLMSKLDAIAGLIMKGYLSELHHIFELVASYGSTQCKEAFINLINNYLDTSQITTDERNSGVVILASLDLDKACNRVIQFSEDRSESAAALFTIVFGDRYRGKQLSFEEIEPIRRLNILKELVIRSYQIVKEMEHNQNEEESYQPNIRDDAKLAGGYLLECLSKTQVVGTISVLYDLSSLPEFSHLSSRLKQMAIELASRISEPQAMSASTFNKFDRELNYSPYDDASLFTVMNNRLDDFEYHLLNDEQSIIDTLRKVEGETELRRFISYWLQQNSRGVYTVTQEAVVITEKRTDIRLLPTAMDKYAAIELKLDDNRNKWTGADLKVALVDQLVGRYLNHERCYVGCLLIGMRKTRKWENPETKEKMNLNETVNWLQGIAYKIMDERPELYISVKGIDYPIVANE
ncbi:hypothetical protein D3X24_09870 [Acinetobacter baumannii]|uniref:hypothetical protein n=1 Tax=Acinetobacter baumannii TaxID=470 RepID=UPI000E69862B|nr:hypothetical protein [Acinetobacter baumannii]RIW62587.1 hypothetical protein D3X24_09870 [Acinetobacter baumannii]